ncbi:hypothetical protein EDB83DRAFT_2309553 [Lactarius deliciosus]|nr:hypothetical protein EDB83DRAFT_2309553 [Lactarius deliciosus]
MRSCARPQTNVDNKEESFLLDNVSGGDDSDNNMSDAESNLQHPGDTQARPEQPLGTAVKRACAEMVQEEEEEVKRLVAEHAREDRAKSPDYYRHPNYAKKPQEFWE